MRTLIASLIAGLVLFSPQVASAAYADLPAGSTLNGTIQQEINTKTAQSGQRFTVVTESGSRIYGHLSEVHRSGAGTKAHVKLNFDSIRFDDGATAPISAEVAAVSEKKQTNYVSAGAKVLGGMVVGNILGKAVGTNVGGLFGVAGGALLASNTSYDIDIPAGAPITIKLTAPLYVGRPQAR